MPRVASEMALHVLAYNLTRVMNIMGIRSRLKSRLGTSRDISAIDRQAGSGDEAGFGAGEITY